MLTDQQIELAARKLCELRGLDPDADSGLKRRSRHERERMAVRNWEEVAMEIAEELSRRQVDEAIAFVESVCPKCPHGSHEGRCGAPWCACVN